MKKTILLPIAFAFFYFNVNAQVSAQLVGKKLHVVSNLNTTTTMMGQDIPSVTEITNEFEIKSISEKSVSLTGVTKRMKIKATAMGTEQNIDTDDPSAKDNPQLAQLFKELNTAKDITAKITKSSIPEDATGVQNVADIANILFIPINSSSKEGSKIIDSTIAENGSKSSDTLTVTKLTPDEITIQADNKLILSGTKQQMGMDVKVNMTTTSTATRIYDIKTGLLKSENRTFTSSGTNEAMGQSFPMAIKGTSSITIQ